MKKYLFPLLFILLTIGGILWTQDLKQKNSEVLFLTKQAKIDYLSFREKYSQRSLVLISHENPTLDLEDFCDEDCEVIPLEKLSDLSPHKDMKNSFLLLEGLKGEESEEDEEDDLLNHDAFKNVLKNILSKYPKIKIAGVPYTNILLDKYSESIKKNLFPLLFLSVFLLLLLLCRSLKIALAVFIPSLGAASLSLVTTKILFRESNLVTSIIPLLLFVVQMSLALHLFKTAIYLKNVRQALIEKKGPILLMVSTTFVGFGSLSFSHLEVISQFGILSSFLILLTTLFTILWSLSINLPYEKLPINTNRINLKFLVYPWKNKTLIVYSLVSLLSAAFLLKGIPIITDATKYFPKEAKVRETFIELSQQTLGTPVLEITLPLSKNRDNIYEELQTIEKLESALRKNGHELLSANTLVKISNLKYAKEFKIPDNIFAYRTLLSSIPSDLKKSFYIDSDYHLTILAPPLDAEEYSNFLKGISNTLKEHDFSNPSFNGLYYHLMTAQKEMMGVLSKSFLLSLILISTMAFFHFKSVQIFFIFLFVNLVPVSSALVLMRLFGLSFNIATIMTFSISLGLIVDSSFHLIHYLKQETYSEEKYVKTILFPVLIASLLLTVSFAFFALNNFLPIREFGIMLAVMIFLGALVDLKILPRLIRKEW